jgi:NADPH:quinone reductase-like Zn-dependent oxidoreductase
MKAYWIHTQEGRTNLELRDVPQPAPGPGQVLLRVRASSLNYGDLFARIARHRADVPRPAGADAAGSVEALGPGVNGIAVGDRVMARARGGLAEYVVADVAQLAPIPPHLDWAQAAAIPIAFVTAYESLFHLGGLAAGESVLIAGASSGVGVAAVQSAKVAGARVIGTSGSAEKLARLNALGMDAGIQARGGDYAAQVLAATGGRGVDLALDLVGGSAFPACQRSLADFGRLGVVGYVDGQMRAELDIESLHGKRLRVFGVSNTPLDAAQRAAAMRGFVREVLPAIDDARITPVVDRVFPFEQLPAAKAYVESNALLGKVVVTLP